MTKHELLLAALIEERWPRRRVEEDAIEVVDIDKVRIAATAKRAQLLLSRFETAVPETAAVKRRRQIDLVTEADAHLHPERKAS